MSNPDSISPDPVMAELFRAEVDMHLPVLSDGLLALEKGRAGPKEIDSMMRAAHSIKGAARIVGIEPAVRVSHVMEDCFTAAKEGKLTLTSDAVDVLLQGVDALQRICSPEPDPGMTEEFIQSVLAQIALVRDGKPATASAAAPSAIVSESSVVANAESNAAAAVPIPSAGTIATSSPAAESIIALPAMLDDSAAESLRGDLCDILEKSPVRIRMDFGQVRHVSAAAVGLLLSFVRETRARQPGPIVEANRVAPPVRALFRVVGLNNSLVMTD